MRLNSYSLAGTSSALLLILPLLAACGTAVETVIGPPAHPAQTGRPAAPVSARRGAARQSEQAAINQAMNRLATTTNVPRWAPRAVAIHSPFLSGNALSVTESGSARQFQVSLVITTHPYPVNSPHINTQAFGINTVVGGFSGQRYGSTAAAQAALTAAPYQGLPSSHPSFIGLARHLRAEEWRYRGRPDLIAWRQKGWLVQVNQLPSRALARSVARFITATRVPARHGVIVVIGATDGQLTQVSWRVGAVDYTVEGRPDSGDTLSLAGSMHPLGSASPVRPAPPIPVAEGYHPFTNRGPNGSFRISIPQQFITQPPPTDHDGRSWRFGSAQITAFSEINADAAHPGLLLNPRTTTITYRAQGPDWRVASGYQGAAIVYAKVLFVGPDIFWLEITYPRADQSTYAPLVTRVANSFTPLANP